MAEFRVWLLHLTAPTLGLSFEPRQSQSFLDPSSRSSCQRKLLERSATVRAARPGEKERGGVHEVSGVLACPKMSAWAWDIQGPACSAYRAVHLAEHQL